MPRSFALAPCVSAFRLPSSLLLGLATLFTTGAQAQFAPPPTGTQVHDTAALQPPAGTSVAIVEFVDLQCPDCARANPLLKDAAAQYKIPWLRHDFPLPFHSWSFEAAVNARWFDLRSKALGDEYRDQVFANQPSIVNLDGLRQFTEKFAASRHIALPAVLDPQGKLAAAVKADYALGQRIGVEHTPTIWIVSTKSTKGSPFVEVVDRDRLEELIHQALADTAAK